MLPRKSTNSRSQRHPIATVFFVLTCIAVCAAGITPADSVVARRFVLRTHPFTSSGSMEYRLFIPQNISDGARYPLIVTLHGAGESGDSWAPIMVHPVAVVWARDSLQEHHPCFIASPRIAFNWRWVDTDWGQGSYNLDNTPITGSLQCVSDIIDSLTREFPVDISRLYITGYSMGGYGTWDMLMRFPNRFAAAIPICGGGDPSKASLLESVPLWTFHAQNDGTIPVRATREMIDALRQTGRTVFYTDCNASGYCDQPANPQEVAAQIENKASLLYSEYPDAGHVCWRSNERGYDNPLLWAWLFTHRRPSVLSSPPSPAITTATAVKSRSRRRVSIEGIRIDTGKGMTADIRGRIIGHP